MVLTYTSNLNLRKPATGDDDWGTDWNSNVDDLDSLHTVGGLSVSISDAASPGLFVDIAAGRFRSTDGDEVSYAGATSQAVVASTTNYVFLDNAGSLTINQSGFPTESDTAHVRLAEVVTNSTQVTTISDVRTTFSVLGGLRIGLRSESADYTAVLADDVILVTAGGIADVTVTLPTAASATGKKITIKKIGGAFNVIVEGDGAETIDGSLNQTISTTNAVMAVVSDGTQWWIIVGGTATSFPLLAPPLSTPPQYSWDGDDTSGWIHSGTNGQIRFMSEGTAKVDLFDNGCRGRTANSFACLNEAASSTNPTLIPDKNELATGIGHAATNELSLIAGSEESVRADKTGTAGNTRLMIYDVDNATLERVTVGAADSGGSGFKLLRIPN